MNEKRVFRVISLFSGCGGLDLGFQSNFSFLNRLYSKNDFEIVFANDIAPQACETFKNFFGIEPFCADIRKVLENNAEIIPDCDIITGGFPCQDFSLAGKRLGFKSERGLLYFSMKRVIELKQPKFFVAENVKGLTNLGNTLETIKREFRDISPQYIVNHRLFNAANYGVPQLRERVLIFGVRKDVYDELGPFCPPQPVLAKEQWITAKEAISDLLTRNKDLRHQNEYSRAKNYGKHAQGNKPIKRDRPSITILAEHHGNIEFHYAAPRRLTVRECARLQSFPDNFCFAGAPSNIYKQIGNAVPPVLAWYVARSIEAYLKGKQKWEGQLEIQQLLLE